LIFDDVARVATDLFDAKWYPPPPVSEEPRADGTATSTIVATLQDFFNDLKEYLLPVAFKRVVSESLDRLIFLYTEAFLTKKLKVSEAFEGRMLADVGEFTPFFAGTLKESIVRDKFKVIEEMSSITQRYLFIYYLMLGP
jgi:hypothetical protein